MDTAECLDFVVFFQKALSFIPAGSYLWIGWSLKASKLCWGGLRITTSRMTTSLGVSTERPGSSPGAHHSSWSTSSYVATGYGQVTSPWSSFFQTCGASPCVCGSPSNKDSKAPSFSVQRLCSAISSCSLWDSPSCNVIWKYLQAESWDNRGAHFSLSGNHILLSTVREQLDCIFCLAF